MDNTIYIGIDGGGTHTTAQAVRADGAILATAHGEGLNYLNDGLNTCIGRFRRLTEGFLSALPAGPKAVCAGLAALDGPADSDVLSAFQKVLPPDCPLYLTSDLYIALMGHTAGRPGLMAVCGTGSMLLALDQAGGEHVSGGWGYKLHDAASGYALARRALIASLDTWEETGLELPLLRAALAYFGAESPRGLIVPLYAKDCGTDRLAGFGARVVQLAENGDREALAILKEETDKLSTQAARLLGRVPEAYRVGLYGGVFSHSLLARSLFTEHLRALCPQARVSPAQYPPTLGAVIHLMRTSGVSPDELPEFKEVNT